MITQGFHRTLVLLQQANHFALLLNFYGVNDQSITLHQVANTGKLTAHDCIDIFLEICYALKHVHSRGYLHNDIKANIVVLECQSTSETFSPVLIDFGKERA